MTLMKGTTYATTTGLKLSKLGELVAWLLGTAVGCIVLTINTTHDAYHVAAIVLLGLSFVVDHIEYRKNKKVNN